MKKALLALSLTALLAACQTNPVPRQTVLSPDASADASALDEASTVDLTFPGSGEGAPTVTPAGPEAPLSAQALQSWPVLKEGSSGADVRTVQYLLTARGYSLSVDSQFGPATESAVRTFQSRNGLSADGVVGPNTWQALILTVREGSRGNAVRAVQRYLNIEADGEFGAGTASAVRSFQSRSGLSADGVVGPNTWQALVAGVQSGGGSTGTSRAELARQILNNSRITLSRSSSTINGSPYQTILDTARGLQATSGCHGNANCGAKVYLDARMLSGMLKVANQYRYTVTSTTGSGEHSAGSDHYYGRAVDIGAVNGATIGYNNGSLIMNACRAAGAAQVLGPGAPGHSTHVHCAWR